MNVILDRARFEQGAFLTLHDATDVSVEFVANVVGQQRLPVFRREDQMHENLGERLRHEMAPFQGLGRLNKS